MSLEVTKTPLEPRPTNIYEVCKIHDFPLELCPFCKDTSIRSLEGEIKRLKEGKFTPEELQNLCHKLDDSDCRLFLKECREHQLKLFGYKKIREALNQLHKEWIKDYRCTMC